MRNMAFSLTIPQFRARTKTVTRRTGWNFLRPGDQVMGCEKCQGIPRGGLVRLGPIEVISSRAERLDLITPAECALEGFPEMSPDDFIFMFIAANINVFPETLINRIEYKYL